MRAPLFLMPLTALALAACGEEASDVSPDEGEAISVEEAVKRAEGAAIKPEPGQYRVSMEVLEIDIPGAPPQAAAMMRDMMGSQSHEYCLKPEDVEKGFEETVRQSQKDSNCTFSKFDVDGSSIDAKMTCTGEGQGTMTMELQGEGSPTRSVMEMTMQGNMTGMGDSTIRMKTTHERIGDCG
ncbi:hypothetical protein AMC99_00823 [Altererythrobacter epoxidivorans]|uniref:DUF3617 domain-containing protein n=1 Tax=Altererythrobacter epoxidivorans TaxID=361183 RepID=A0A0M3TA45_9SPHN|nr:DUF3617 domain-containing protein [Altererythrobacter epoxidivorans]ALE16126.1 hypothetical protein AMC99_00823 [Altererythrobacter epoxidivorans]